MHGIQNEVVSVQGSTLKTVKCSSCSTEFVYCMRRSATGSAMTVFWTDLEGTRKEAAKDAKRYLAGALDREFDAVPCPACGHYQDYMIPKLRALQMHWARPLAITTLILSVCMIPMALMFWADYMQRPSEASLFGAIAMSLLSGSLGLTGVSALTRRYLRLRLFDPNAGDSAERIAIGRRRALTKAQFEDAKCRTVEEEARGQG
jgi:hypothetical protein